MQERLIETPDCVAEGAAWLAARHPALGRALAETGPLPLRRQPDGFAALLDAILGQQVSTASARAIRARMQAAGLWDEDSIAAAGDAALRAAPPATRRCVPPACRARRRAMRRRWPWRGWITAPCGRRPAIR